MRKAMYNNKNSSGMQLCGQENKFKCLSAACLQLATPT